MRVIKSEYVVKLYDLGIIGSEESFNSLYIVMEFVKSDLKQLQAKEEPLSVRQVK